MVNIDSRVTSFLCLPLLTDGKPLANWNNIMDYLHIIELIIGTNNITIEKKGFSTLQRIK